MKHIKSKDDYKENQGNAKLAIVTFAAKNRFSHPLKTFQLMETFNSGKNLNLIFHVVVSGPTNFEDFAVVFSASVVCGHKKHV